MKKNTSLYIYIVFSFLFFLSLFLIFFIPLSFSKSTWKNYKVLFLPIESDASLILDVAQKEGIKGIISVESTKNRFFDIDNCLYTVPEFTEKDRYAQWFLNDQENIQYMYIPDSQKITSNFLNFLKVNFDFFYIEDINPFSFFQLAIAFLFFCVSLFFAKRKSIYFFASLPLIIYAGFQKGILALTATLLMMYTIAFWVEALGFYLKFTKSQLLRRIKKNPLLVFLPVISLVIAKFNSNLSLLLFVLALICGGSAVFIVEKIIFFINKKTEEKKLHKQITPYVMNPNSIDKFWGSKKLFIVSGMTVVLIVFSAIFLFFNFNKMMPAYNNTVFLPIPAKNLSTAGFLKDQFDNVKNIRSGEDLPDLANFIYDKWYCEIIPYLSLNKGQVSEVVNITDFSVDKSGVITEKDSIVLALNDEFIHKILSFRKGPIIEDLLYEQGRFVTAVYSSKQFPLNIFNFAALIVALLSSLLPMIIIFMRVFER